jgi:hypothetical protein
MGKLTKAQKRELINLPLDAWCHYAEGYKPIRRLLDLGYVEWKPAKLGGTLFRITDAGRQALSEGEQQ